MLKNKYPHLLRVIGFISYIVVVSSTGLSQAQKQAHPASSAAANAEQLIVSIDNPNFRKLVAAVPKFSPESTDQRLETTGAKGAQELGDLLVFSGLFNVMSDAAFSDILKSKANPTAKNPTASVVEGVDLAPWKAIGVESLTLSSIGIKDGLYTLTMKTIDINRGTLVLGKQFSKVKDSEITSVVRRYADLLLKAYTGKPGIFSSKLVFVGRKTKASAKQIYVSDFDGSNTVQITKENAPHLSPQWSHDGRFITYTSYRDGNPDLFIYELASGKSSKLSGKKGINSGSNWSPDDKLIAFTGSVEGNADIYLIQPFQKKERSLFISGSGLDVDPAFSPDKKHLAYVSGRYGNPHIFRADLQWETPTEVKVVGEQRLTFVGWYNAVPAWSPDSEKIAFAGYDKDIDRFDLFMMSPDGKQMERLTLRTGDNESPSWSPNGQLIVFHSNRTNGTNVKSVAQIFIMNRDGSSQRMLNTGLYEAQTPKWSNNFE